MFGSGPEAGTTVRDEDWQHGQHDALISMPRADSEPETRAKDRVLRAAHLPGSLSWWSHSPQSREFKLWRTCAVGLATPSQSFKDVQLPRPS